MKGPSREVLAAITSASEAVIGMAVLAALGVWGGAWLDERFHTTPWLAISLALVGASLGLLRMVLKALASDKG